MDIEIKKLEYSRGNFQFSLDSFFPEGKLTAILGPSGSGKTTLLQLFAGFLQPDRGQILFRGEDLTRQDPKDRHLGMIFQNYALFPHMSVRENIAYGLKARKTDPSVRKKAVEEMLGLMELNGKADRKPSELSGGEQQRVAIGRALILNPRIFLMDEPLSALDAALREQLRQEIKRIQKKTGITTVYVTHDQQEALALADHLVILDQGQLIQSGTPQEVYQNPCDAFSARFLGKANLIALTSDSKGELFYPSGEPCPLPIAPAAPDRDYWLFFRPENTEVRSNSRGIFTGIMQSCQFRGREYLCTCQTEAGTLLFYSEQSFPPGKQLTLSPEKDCYILLPGEEKNHY